MTNVSAVIKDRYTSARNQLDQIEKQVEEKVAQFEQKAKASLVDVKESIDTVPAQLKGAWETVVARLRGGLNFATKEEIETVNARIDELARRVDKFLRTEKIRTVAVKPKAAK